MSLYKRGAIWWGLVYHGGERYRRSMATESKPLAAKRLEAWKRQIVDGDYGIGTHMWSEAAARWTEEVMPGSLRVGSQKRYLSSLRQVEPLLRKLEVAKITEQHLAQIALRKGPTNATKRRDLTAVMAVLYAAEAWGWIKKAPDTRQALRLIPEKRDPIVLPRQEAVDAVVASAMGTLGPLVRFLELTGMRLEEAGGLEWTNVDLDRDEIHLSKTKTWRARTLAITPEVRTLLQSLPRHRYVFSKADGTRYGNLSSRMWEEIGKVGGGFRAHDLRHKFAVDYLRKGGSIYQLQRILGHSTVKTTEGYLAYVTPEQRQEVMR